MTSDTSIVRRMRQQTGNENVEVCFANFFEPPANKLGLEPLNSALSLPWNHASTRYLSFAHYELERR